MRITIKSIKENKAQSGNLWYSLEDMNGNNYSGFGMSAVHAGDTLECEVVTKGKYKNIQDGWAKVELEAGSLEKEKVAPQKPVVEPKPEVRPEPKRWNEDSTEKRTSIERQNALTNAVQFHSILCPTDKRYVVLDTAQKFAHWVATGEYEMDIELQIEPLNIDANPRLVQEAQNLGGEVKSVETMLPEYETMADTDLWNIMVNAKDEKKMSNEAVRQLSQTNIKKVFTKMSDLSHKELVVMAQAMKSYTPPVKTA